MSRWATTLFLAGYFALLWGAVLLRVDRFPLTWAPMYSTFEASDRLRVRMLDAERLEQGLLVTRADGRRDFVDRHDLNLPRWHFWRLYGQRMEGRGPIKHRQGNAALSPFNRWWRGLEPGEENFRADWPQRILHSLNQTLGHEPGAPEFIVRAEALHLQRHYRTSDLALLSEEQRKHVAEARAPAPEAAERVGR